MRRHTVLSRDEEPQERGASDGTTLGIEYGGAIPQTRELLRGGEDNGAGEGISLGLGGVTASQSPSRTEVQVIPATAIPPIDPTWTSSAVSATSPPSAYSPPPPSSQSVPPLSSPVPQINVPQTPFPTRPATAPTASSNTHPPKLIRRTQSDSWETPPSVVPDSQPTLRSEKHIIPSSDLSSPSSSSRNSHHSPRSAKRRRFASPRKAASSTASESQPRRPLSTLVPTHRISPSGVHSSPTERTRLITSTNATSSTASPSQPYSPSSQPLSSSSPPRGPPPQLIPSPLPPGPPIHSTIATHLVISTHKPPPPATALAPFTTHITPSLSIIAYQLPLEKFFRPVHTVRALRVLERGYWVVDLGPRDNTPERGITPGEGGKGVQRGKEKKNGDEGSGPKGKKAENGRGGHTDWHPRFWTYLTRFLHEGRAGWGVWCERSLTTAPQPAHACRDVVTIYCWGEVVGHIWLLLFLASERKVRGLGARWVDAGGEVVVRMG